MKDYKQIGISRGGIGYEEKLSNFRGNFGEGTGNPL